MVLITFILRGRDARAPCGGGHHDETACYWIVSESCLADTIEGVAGVAAKRIVEAFEDVRPRDADHGLVGVLAEIVVGEGRDARRVAGLDLATCAVVGKRYRRRVVRINGVRERSACVIEVIGYDAARPNAACEFAVRRVVVARSLAIGVELVRHTARRFVVEPAGGVASVRGAGDVAPYHRDI